LTILPGGLYWPERSIFPSLLCRKPMGRKIVGSMVATGKRFALVVSRFNGFFTERLRDGAMETLQQHGVRAEDVDEIWVPGAFEIPVAALRAARCGRYHAVVCLGTVIRGATPHFDYVAGESAKGIAWAGLQTGVPVIYGVITADTIEQAIERSGTKMGNKGCDAATAAIEMANLLEQIAP